MTFTLTTSRLLLRPLAENDAAEMAGIINNERISRNLARVKFPYLLDDAHTWLATLTHSREGSHVRAIILAKTLIGVIGIESDSSGNSPELGYWLGEPWWGRGYTSEASGALLDWVFAHERYERVTAAYRYGNEASWRLLMRLGFRHVGHQSIFSSARRGVMATATVEITRRERLFAKQEWAGR